MDFSHPTNSQSEKRPRKRRLLRFLLWTVALLPVVAIILVLAAPTILSLGPARSYILETVNEKIAPASVSVDDWSLAWFGEQSVTGITYSDPDAGVHLNVASVSMGSLWSLVPIGRIEVTVTVDTPALTCTLPAEKSTPAVPTDTVGETVAEPFALPDWDIGLTLVVRDASVRFQGQPTPILSDADLNLSMPSFTSPSELRLSAALPEAELSLEAETASLRACLARALPLPDCAGLNLEGAWGNADLRLTATPGTDPLPEATVSADLDLGKLYAGAARFGLTNSLPVSEVAGQVRLTGTFAPESADLAAAELLTTLTGIRFVSDGQPLRCDGPISLRTTARIDRTASVRVPGLDAGMPLSQAFCSLSAPWGSFSITAMPTDSGSDIPKADVKLHLLLAELCRFVEGLGIQTEGLRVDGGELDGTLAVTPIDADATDVVLTLRPDGVRCSWEGKPLNVSPNVDLSAKVNGNDPLTSEIRRLSVEFPGLLASGSGSLSKGELAAALDIRELTRLAAPFTGMKPIDKPLSVTFRLNADRQALALTSQAKSDRALLTDVSLKVNGLNIGTRSFTGAELKSDTDLGALLRFYPIEGLPLQTAEARLLFNATAAGDPDNFKAKTVFALRDTDLRTTAWHVKESELLSGTADLSYTKGQIAVPAITLKSPIFTAKGSLASADPLNLTLSGTLAPNRVFSAWKIWGRDETPFALTGTLPYSVTAALPAAALKISSEDLFYAPASGPAFSLPFTLDTAVTLEEANASAVRIDRMAFTSAYADCSAAGAFRDGRLTLNGDLAPDFGAIWALPFFDSAREQVILAGKSSRPFTLDAPVTDGLPGILNYGRAEAGLYLERVEVPGISISETTFSAKLADAALTLDGSAKMNGGTLRINPTIAVGMEPYTITLPADAVIIDSFGLTQEMVNTGLCYIAPVLADSASPNGTFSLSAKKFSMRLDDDPMASLEADLLFSTEDISVAPNGLLGNILNLLRLRERAAYLPDQQLPITIRGTKLTTDELSLRIAALKLRCAGTTDLRNGIVDYRLTVPLTEQLIGERASRYIGTQSIVIPIHGTANNPQADTSMLSELLGKIVNNAVTREVGNQLNRLFNGDTASDVLDFSGEAVGDGVDAVKDGTKAIFDLFR